MLTGTTWYFNTTIDVTSIWNLMPFTNTDGLFTCNDVQYKQFTGEDSIDEYGSMPGALDYLNPDSQTGEMAYVIDPEFAIQAGWQDEVFRTITFINEPVANSSALETWLSENATMTSSGSSASYIVSGSDLSSIANAIRAKTGGSTELAFPADFVSAINGITTLAEGTESATATADKISNGYSAYVKGKKIVGTYYPKVSNVLLSQNRNGGGVLSAGFHTQGSLLFTFKKPNLEYWSSSSLNPRLNVSTYSSYVALQFSFASGEDPKIMGYANQDFRSTSSSYIGVSYTAQAVVSLV